MQTHGSIQCIVGAGASCGRQHARPQRGLITRPSLAEVLAWRAEVDARVLRLLQAPHAAEVDALVELGLQHEQQHQELFLTEILHIRWSCPEPLRRAYAPSRKAAAAPEPESLGAVAVAGGRLLAVWPKTYLPNYGEFYEARQFSAATAFA